MPISMFSASVPYFQHHMRAFAAVLKKGEAFATARGFEPSVLLQSRLAPDMFPLVRQVHIATDQAKGGPARLAGVEAPTFADDETTFAQLQDRIARVQSFLATLKPAQIDGSEEREIVLAMRVGELRFTGQQYLLSFVIPNMLFHTATAYDILRHNGVELGKRDYLGGA